MEQEQAFRLSDIDIDKATLAELKDLEAEVSSRITELEQTVETPKQIERLIRYYYNIGGKYEELNKILERTKKLWGDV